MHNVVYSTEQIKADENFAHNPDRKTSVYHVITECKHWHDRQLGLGESSFLLLESVEYLVEYSSTRQGKAVK